MSTVQERMEEVRPLIEGVYYRHTCDRLWSLHVACKDNNVFVAIAPIPDTPFARMGAQAVYMELRPDDKIEDFVDDLDFHMKSMTIFDLSSIPVLFPDSPEAKQINENLERAKAMGY